MNRCLRCLRMVLAQDTTSLISRRVIYTSRIFLYSNNNSNNDNDSMIRLIGADGKPMGIMKKLEAEQVAKKEKFALKQIAKASETITNSVYKLIELKTPSTLKRYSAGGKSAAASKTVAKSATTKQQRPSQQSEKELTMKSQIQDNDLNVKAKKLQQFLDRGFQVTIKIVKPRRVTILPRDTYERLVSKLDCEVVLKGTPKASDSFFRGIVSAKNSTSEK